MNAVTNMYRAKRGKGDRLSRLMARTRVGVCSFLHTAVSAIEGVA